jgi:TFIIH basal transcription factor complex TTD-A subunit
MVEAVVGVLVQCDEAMKQLLLQLDKEERFIIEDLDSTHVFIDPKHVEKLKQRFEIALEENVYKIEGGVEIKSTW